MLRRTLTMTSVTALVALTLTACGGSGGGGNNGVASLESNGDGNNASGSTDTTVADEDLEEALLDWAACMRENGVDIPDPQVDGDGRIMIGGPPPGGDDDDSDSGASTDPPDREAMDQAREECGDPPRPAGSFSEQDREEMQEHALKLAECMRDEGIEDFPDPDFSQMGPGVVTRENDSADDEADDGEARLSAGPFGDIDMDDPEVQAAMDACREKLGDDFAGPRFGSQRAQDGEG
jgi:hypothetical protein